MSRGHRRSTSSPVARRGHRPFAPLDGDLDCGLAVQILWPRIGALTWRTNVGDRLYISTFTVGTHLRHIYQKLGINSRLQLAAETRRHHRNDIG